MTAALHMPRGRGGHWFLVGLCAALLAGCAPRSRVVLVDAATLKPFTGDGFTMSVPPGWSAIGGGLVGGPLPNGNQAVINVLVTAAPQGGTLDGITSAAARQITAKTSWQLIGQSKTQVHGQRATLTDFSARDAQSQPAVIRQAIWLDGSNEWQAIYTVVGRQLDPGPAGLDMFSSTLLPTIVPTD